MTTGIVNNSTRQTSSPTDIDSNANKKGMVLPFTPQSITFDEIRYSVDMPEVTSFHIAVCLTVAFN